MLPQGGAVEEPKDQLMIQFMIVVPGGHIPEETVVRPQDVVHPGPHLPPQPDHTPHTNLLCPGPSERKKVLQNVFDYHRFQRHRNFLIPSVSFGDDQTCIEITGHQQIGRVWALADDYDNALNG